MTASVGFAEISTAVLVENIIAEIKEQYLADDTPWIWYHDFHDAPSVTEIYYEVFGEEFAMNKEINQRRAKDRQLLEEICQAQGVPVELVEQLLQIEKDKSGLMRRNNLFKDIDMALKNYLKRQEVESLKLTAVSF